jgi:hypothetical protein
MALDGRDGNSGLSYLTDATRNIEGGRRIELKGMKFEEEIGYDDDQQFGSRSLISVNS